MLMIKTIWAICLFCQVVTSNPTKWDEWQRYKTKYHKLYDNQDEENYRKKIFFDHLDEIEEHNRKYEQRLVSYSVAINQYTDHHVKEIIPGSRPNSSPKPNFQPFSSQDEVPESIDWRDYGVITPIVDQDFCLACWSFAVVAAIEAHVGIYLGQTQRKLSQENLIDCVYAAFKCTDEMNRTALEDSYQYIIDNGGIDTAASYPYDQYPNNCRFNPETIGAKIKDYVTLPEGDEELLKTVVGTVGPVSVIITTDFSFTAYREGVYYKEDCLNTTEPYNHAVTVIGYGNEDGQDYWLIRNEWGLFFGEQGYAKMARNRDNNCGIATYASYPIIDTL